MADKTTFQTNVEALLSGMDGFLTTKTVIGEALHVGDNILLPLADVSFGVGAGAFEDNAKSRGAGGMGAKITPSAILVVNENGAKMVTVKSQDTLGKLIDMIPDIAAKFTKKNKKVDYTEEFEDEGLDI